MVKSHDVEIAVIGAGIVGLATAYFLAVHNRVRRLLIIDMGQPMTLTSAHSGENYRNWWPHPTMTAFTNYSIGLMEDIARRTANRINMTRRGYVLATRDARPDRLLRELYLGYGAAAEASIRIHERSGTISYARTRASDWDVAPAGVDVLLDRALTREQFPEFDPEVSTILHIRRAGDISGQQLGQYMLEEIRAAGGLFRRARVRGISRAGRFSLEVEADDTRHVVNADVIVNAAGPFAPHVSSLLGETLPIDNVLQQKIAFPDRKAAISRQMPFAIDLDDQAIAWTDQEREALAADAGLCALLEPMPGSVHCRPDGGEQGQWIKLGWAYNRKPSEASREPELDPNFPEIVLRAASRLLPRLKPYIGFMPRERRHYGGYYTMTRENWPLIGSSRTNGVFLVAALSGYGTMAACGAGDLCARAIVGSRAPHYATALSLARYEDTALMAELSNTAARGLL